MIEVKIPKEIRTYKETLFFGLNLRQTLCMAAAFAVNVPLFWTLQCWVGIDLAGWIIIATSSPFMLIGFAKINGMPFERLAICAVRVMFRPQQYPYKSENYFAQYRNEGVSNASESDKKEIWRKARTKKEK